MAGSVAISAAAVTTVPKEAMTIKAAKTGVAVDKQNNYSPAYVTYQGNTAVVSILNPDLSVKKQFTINNVGEDGDRKIEGTYAWGDFMNVDPGAEAYVTQGLYNSDDKWEVVIGVEKREMVKDPEGYEYETTTTSYVVVNEDNEEVCIPAVSSDGGYTELAEYAYINNRFYSVVENEEEGTWVFYTYEAGSSAAPIVSINRSASIAYPNPLPSGRVLTIEFENEAEAGTTVEVYDMRGRRVFSTAVAEGETKAMIPSRRLHSGNYVYVVSRNGVSAEKGKIIAK